MRYWTGMPVCLFNAFLIGGTAYVVFWMGHSGWWFVAAACFLMQHTEDEDKK